jgi:aspartate carbamoyltransferase regulatory subunit
MEINKKKLQVSAIENGTVLDHIPANQLFRVIDILHLQNSESEMTFGTNLQSKSSGRKALIKLADRYFKDDELNTIALIAPNATVNIIKNFEVVEKKIISTPEKLIGIVKCKNPVCVTNHQDIKTRFTVLHKNDEIELFCNYCEKVTDIKNLTIVSNLR